MGSPNPIYSLENKTLPELLSNLCVSANSPLGPKIATFLDNDLLNSTNGPKGIPSTDNQAINQLSFYNALLTNKAESPPFRLDQGIETYSLAQFLYWAKPPGMCFSITSANLEDYRRKFSLSPIPKKESLIYLDIAQSGAQLRVKSDDWKDTYYKPHFDNNKQEILRATDSMSQNGRGDSDPTKRPQIMVLGAGSCKDVPLEALVEKGYTVTLVDIDEDSMKSAIQELEKKHLGWGKYVSYEVRDVSGGYISKLSSTVAETIQYAIDRDKSDEWVLQDLTEQLLFLTPPFVPILEGTNHVDMLVSTMLATEIPQFLISQIERQLHEKLNVRKGALLSFVQNVGTTWGSLMHDAHVAALKDYVIRSNGIVFYSTDIAATKTFIDTYSDSPVFQRGHRFGIQKRKDYPFNRRPLLLHNFSRVTQLKDVFTDSPFIRIVKTNAWDWEQIPAEKQQAEYHPTGVKQQIGLVRDIQTVILAPSSSSR